jgi:hypothetical protein
MLSNRQPAPGQKTLTIAAFDVPVLFMADNAAQIDPDDRETRTQARAERQLSMLAELAEIGMQMARAVRDEAVARADAVDGAARPSRFGSGDLGLVYSRIARAVRQTLALETRLADEIEKAGVERARDRLETLRRAATERQEQIRDYVAEAIEAEAVERNAADSDVERLLDDLDERIEAGDYDDTLDTAPIGELVARICADLGVIPDWDLWNDQEWALDHLKAQTLAADIGADRWAYLYPPSGPTDPPATSPDTG